MKRNRCKARLRLYPDPILKAVCEPVGDDEDVSGIIRDMMHILTNSKTGVGLAAPQAGHTKRVIIAKTSGVTYTTMINPYFVPAEYSSKERGQEQCLSYPGKTAILSRETDIAVHYIDEHGQFEWGTYIDFTARIIQHEIDHLDGECKIGDTNNG